MNKKHDNTSTLLTVRVLLIQVVAVAVIMTQSVVVQGE